MSIATLAAASAIQCARRDGAPGKAHRESIGLLEPIDPFPDETEARAWFEGARWAGRRTCPRCN